MVITDSDYLKARSEGKRICGICKTVYDPEQFRVKIFGNTYVSMVKCEKCAEEDGEVIHLR